MTSMSSGFTGDGCCNMGTDGDVQNGPDCVIIPGAVKVILVDTFVLIVLEIWQVQSNNIRIALTFKDNPIKLLDLRPQDAQVTVSMRNFRETSEWPILLANLSWVFYHLYCSTFCQVLPVLMENWQKWLSRWARW